MTAYHATHPSPYDDACPDCTGYPEVIEDDSREWSRLTVLVCIALALLLVELAAWFGRHP